MSIMNRRKFVSLLSVSTALSALTRSREILANATDLPLVDANSEQAKALNYLPLSQTDGKSCSTCVFFQGIAGAKLGPCPLFPGSSVSADAVCAAWTAKS